MGKMTLEDVSRLQCVRARKRIEDVPTNPAPPAPRGVRGEVCDVDFANSIVFVDFGDGAIACLPSELAVA